MLTLVSTPIGNLNDITLRALEALKSADLILCEDTRRSLQLLNHFEIKKPLQSYHLFNEVEKLEPILEILRNEKNVCLISDAGTPLIADPGYLLVKKCYEENIKVAAIPGATALIQALILSTFSSLRFQFVGFIPKKEKELYQFALDAKYYKGTTVAYESPHRILSTLEALQKVLPNRTLAIGRELTKKFEEILRGKPSELLDHFEKNPPLGEMVLLIEEGNEEASYSLLTPIEHVLEIETTFQVSKKEAIKIVASLREMNKRELYTQFFSDPLC